jgi:hypothetical protein
MTRVDVLKVLASVVAVLIATGAALDYFLIYGKRQSRLHTLACDAWLRFDATPVEALYLLVALWPARVWRRLTRGDAFRARRVGCLCSFGLTAAASALACFQERRGDPHLSSNLYYSAVELPVGELLINLPGDFLGVMFAGYAIQRLSGLYAVRIDPAPSISASVSRRAILLLLATVLVTAFGRLSASPCWPSIIRSGWAPPRLLTLISAPSFGSEHLQISLNGSSGCRG